MTKNKLQNLKNLRRFIHFFRKTITLSKITNPNFGFKIIIFVFAILILERKKIGVTNAVIPFYQKFNLLNIYCVRSFFMQLLCQKLEPEKSNIHNLIWANFTENRLAKKAEIEKKVKHLFRENPPTI